MRELSLFSGAGGGLLASRLLGWRTIGYVENDDYCQRIIAQRIRDGFLDRAPIFGDIRAFIGDGFAAQYQGMADVVSAGFPCQPFSTAGKRAGADDPRNMWPQTADALRVVRPRFAFLENVPGLLTGSHGYFGTILSELAALGYDARWGVLSACAIGAPHTRERLFILAYASRRHGQAGLWPRHWEASHVGAFEIPKGDRRQMRADWMDSVSRNAGSGAGHPHRVDRLKATGNGQVPVVAAAAWHLLTTPAPKP